MGGWIQEGGNRWWETGAVSVVINGLNWISVGRLIADCRGRRRRRTKLRTKLRREWSGPIVTRERWRRISGGTLCRK